MTNNNMNTRKIDMENTIEETSEDYRFVVEKHKTYRQEMVVKSTIFNIGSIIITLLISISSLILIGGDPISRAGFGLAITCSFARLMKTLHNQYIELNTLYDYQIKNIEIENNDKYKYIGVLDVVAIISFLAGIVSAFII